jgi:hypothetical protein
MEMRKLLREKYLWGAGGVTGVHIGLLVKLRFTVWPEMVMFPWLLDHGFELYRDLINPYWPGLTWLLWGWFKVWGFGFGQLKILTWLVILVTDGLVYGLTVRLSGKKWAGLVALAFFVFWQPVLEGNGLWHDIVLTLVLLLALCVLSLKFKIQNSKLQFKVNNLKFWLAGMLLGVMVMVKQSAGWYLFAASFAAILELRIKNYESRGEGGPVLDFARTMIGKLVSLWLPAVVMAVGVGVWFWVKGLGDDWWWWTVKLPLGMAGRLPGHELVPTGRQLAVVGVVTLPLIGLLISNLKSQISKLQFKSQNWNTSVYLWLFWVASLGLAYPRFGFFHLQPWLGVTAVMVGYLVSRIKYQVLWGKLGRWGLMGLTSVWLIGAVGIWGWFLRGNWHGEDRFGERSVYQLADYVKENYADRRMMVFNAPQLVYFLTNKLPPKPWADNFSWFMEVPGVQERMVEGMKEEEVTVVITKWIPEEERSWEVGKYYPERLGKYLEENFREVDEAGGIWVMEKNE